MAKPGLMMKLVGGLFVAVGVGAGLLAYNQHSNVQKSELLLEDRLKSLSESKAKVGRAGDDERAAGWNLRRFESDQTSARSARDTLSHFEGDRNMLAAAAAVGLVAGAALLVVGRAKRKKALKLSSDDRSDAA